MHYPFKEKFLEKNTIIREFSNETSSNELHWHKDQEDRIIVPLNKNDWMFQRDNELPQKLNKTIEIKANEWHRAIKGTTDLIIKVIKK